MDNIIHLEVPPYPMFRISAFREFEEGEWHITRKNMEYILIIMVEGKLYFTENGREVELNKDEFYIQRPNIYQSALRPSKTPKYYYIHFTQEVSDYTGYFPAKTLILPTRGKCKVHVYRNYLDRIAYAHLDSASDILEVQSLFLDFLQFFYENEIEQPKCNAGTVLLDYMRKNYQSHITLKTLSELVNFSEDYTRSIFKKRYGIAPLEYLAKIRLEMACKLLCTTDYSIEKIAYDVGFGDVSVFYRNFVKAFNMAPSKWRSMSRNM